MYKGIVKVFKSSGNYGFIDLPSVTKDDGDLANIETTQDIFVHTDQLDGPLRHGMEVFFNVSPDEKRGGDALRACQAFETPSSGLAFLGLGGIQLNLQGAGN